MDYYQGVVADYLRADRSLFLNSECCIQLNPGDNPDTTGPHWFCDILACDLRQKQAFLCEITFSRSMSALLKRLKDWHSNWQLVQVALRRDCGLPADWPARPWLFIPEPYVPQLLNGLKKIAPDGSLAFNPLITTLEMVQPWRYRSWNRIGEVAKPDCVPPDMRI